MKKIKLFKQVISCTLVLLLVIPFNALSEQIAGAENNFAPEELEQMLAPIALYPDALLAQVLTAATYPLEIVEADRFVKANPGLIGEALLRQAEDQDWEPSVKAMLEFPDLLAMMDEQLDWTQKLGSAFLTQQSDCMDTVQNLRQKAFAQGNLATSENQVVKVEPVTRIIIIEPARPEVVYVPVYDPLIIYGHWWHPRYPPYHFYPRRYSGMSFFFGVFVVTLWGGWGSWDCNWYNHHVYVNSNHYNNFTRTYYRSGDHHRFFQYGQDHEPWRYDARHRQASGYRSTFTAKPYAPVLRYNRQITVKPPVIATPKPVINSPTKSPNFQIISKKMPAAVLKEILAKRPKTGPTVKTDVRRIVEKPKSTEILTRNFMTQQVTKYSAPQVNVNARRVKEKPKSTETVTRDFRAQEVARSYAVNNHVRGDMKDQVVIRPPASNSRPKEDGAEVLVAIAKEKGRQATKYKLSSNQLVLSRSKSSAVLRAGPKFVPRKEYDDWSR